MLSQFISSFGIIYLRVFENRVLSRRLGPKRDEVIRGWRRAS
jgi:hypothetical protein